MKLKDTLIAWNPGTNKIKVGPLLSRDCIDWTLGFARTGGAAYSDVRSLSGKDAKLRIMSDFIGITARDGVCPKSCHNAFMLIDEYRNAVPTDMEVFL